MELSNSFVAEYKNYVKSQQSEEATQTVLFDNILYTSWGRIADFSPPSIGLIQVGH